MRIHPEKVFGAECSQFCSCPHARVEQPEKPRPGPRTRLLAGVLRGLWGSCPLFCQTQAAWTPPSRVLVIVQPEGKRALKCHTSAIKCSVLEMTLQLTTHGHNWSCVCIQLLRARKTTLLRVHGERGGLSVSSTIATTSFRSLAVYSALQSYTPALCMLS